MAQFSRVCVGVWKRTQREEDKMIDSKYIIWFFIGSVFSTSICLGLFVSEAFFIITIAVFLAMCYGLYHIAFGDKNVNY
jgi:hypothetical protein